MDQILSFLVDQAEQAEQANREIYAEFLKLLLAQMQVQQQMKGMDLTGSVEIKKLGKETLDFAEVEVLAFHLSLQLQALEARAKTLLFWQPSDLLVIQWPNLNVKLYLLANLTQLVPLAEKAPTQLVLVYPAVYPLPSESCAPELLKITSLPFITHRSASYYSLALLCLRLLGHKSAPATLGLDLAALTGTKLFYFLERCLHPDPKERMCLYL
jgi:hypothetical protein